MGNRNRVAWREGMFLRPQHFQAQDRHYESYVSSRLGWALPYSWGFAEIELDLSLAELGKIGITSAKGIMQDGTPFSIPGEQAPPPTLEISTEVQDKIVYLTLPPQQVGSVEFKHHETAADDSRFLVHESEINDSFSKDVSTETISVGTPNLKIGISSEDIEGRLTIGIAKIKDVSGKKITFDDSYIPPTIDIRAVNLKKKLTDLIGRCDHMIGELALRASESTEGGQDTYKAFLLLQSLNRWHSVLTHLDSMPAIHPERLFETLIAMASDISTLIRSDRRPPPLPKYDHENLQGSFDPVVELLQSLLSGELDRSVERLTLEERGLGQYLHPIRNRSLIKNSYLYLAVSDKTKSLEDIRKRFPSVCKIGPNTKMKELVGSSLKTGIPLRHTTTPPTQLRVLPGFVYFELDRGAEDWAVVHTAPAIGLFVADEWPELNLELWAVKQK